MKVIITIGFFVHIIFLFSIFDIYFKSPVITGIPPRPELTDAPANRLVLFVADGLRADSFFRLNHNKSSETPYLRSILEKYGTWGVSHTRVPTESRPGHVALIAGLYEDPSAVARGWQENPVHFDSAFNRSTETWSWGSPDILPMFSKGSKSGKVHTYYYNSEEEDFSGKSDTFLLDLWVFKKVENFFNDARKDKDLFLRLHQKKIIFFLHLLGLDTAGHTYKPYSRELEKNLNIVDAGIKQIEKVIQTFYNYDNKTAFIFTSDHGMTDWGSHGSGSTHETETPIVSWGAGINFPKESINLKSTLSPINWGVNDKFRKDIMQADVSPLISALIGSAVSVNSVGMLPLPYLNASHEYLAKAYFHNALQLGDQYKHKKTLVESNLWNIFKRPFNELDDNSMKNIIANVEHSMQLKKYDDVIKISKILMVKSTVGLEYYHTYYQVLLLSCISLSFISWIILLLINIFSTNERRKSFHPYYGIFDIGYGCAIITVMFIIFKQSLPAIMYIYCGLPFMLWWAVCRKLRLISCDMKSKNVFFVLKAIGVSAAYIIGTEIMVLSFFYRYLLSICIVFLCLWGFMNLNQSDKLVKFHWILSSLMLAIFPAMPIEKGDDGSNTSLIFLGGLLWIILSILQFKRSLDITSMIQILFLLMSMLVVVSTRNNFKERLGLPLKNMIVSWILLVVSPLFILVASLQITLRLKHIGRGLAVPFILLSVGHEPIFLLTLFSHLEAWLKLECFISKPSANVDKMRFDDVALSNANINNDDFRRCYLFLFYIIVCFFGTGNVASLSSFDPSWVRCFVATFSPFLMGGLIILKTLIPFLMITCYWHATNVIKKVTAKKLFLGVLIFSNIMGFHFLFLVQNEGSWLDIGTSISHYVIMQTIVLVLLLIFGIAKCLTSIKLFSSKDIYIKKSLEFGKHY